MLNKDGLINKIKLIKRNQELSCIILDNFGSFKIIIKLINMKEKKFYLYVSLLCRIIKLIYELIEENYCYKRNYIGSQYYNMYKKRIILIGNFIIVIFVIN